MAHPDRLVVIAGNWKLNKLRGEALEFSGDLDMWIDEHVPEGNERLRIAVAPTFTSLETVVDTGPNHGVLAQNMHQADSGAFTGEVSPAMLRDVGVDGVLLGHSERRQYFNETDEALAEKVPAALDFGLQAMLCVGETLEERKAGQAEAVVERQLRTALADVDVDHVDKLSVAYEPVWAIGTGETATPEQAQEIHAHVRSILTDLFKEAGAKVPVLYGGSVKPGNAAELLGQPDIDGALIGGAALDIDDFTAICAAGLALVTEAATA
jgi:triosephosphate isomerase